MLEKIISLTLDKRKSILFISSLLVIFGIYSYFNLQIDAFPDVTNKQVEIISHANGLSALEIERLVTYPVEMSMRGLPNLKQMRSVTKFGISIVTLIFEDNSDIFFARQRVFERLSEAKENVPKGVEITLSPIATVMGEIYQFTLNGKEPTDPKEKIKYLTRLRTLEEWVVTPALKSISGVNEINSFGGYFKQFQVVVSPEKLLKYDVTFQDVFNSIEKNNQNVGGNIVEKNSEQFIVRGIGLIKDINDLKNTVLKSVDGTPVYLKDVADINDGEALRQGAALINGKDECVGGIVMMLRGENSREVVKRVEEKVSDINNSNLLPDDIKIVPFYDRSDIVNASIGTVNTALLEGAVLVLLILYLILKSFRGSIVVLIALPLSMLVTFIFMKLGGISANLMSLGGLAISIGMIIDATIIQVENVQRHLSENKNPTNKLKTVLKAVLEVRKPSIFGELIIAVTFLPILTLEGIEGKMFAPLAITVAIALISSLLLSIFIIPVLCSLVLKTQVESESFIMILTRKFYHPLLLFSIKHKFYMLAIAGVLLVISLFLLKGLGSEFIPVMDEGAFDMDITMLPSVSLNKSIEINKLIGEKLKKFPELVTVVQRIGQTGVSLDTRGVDKTGYVGILKPRKEWRKNFSREKLMDEMRESLSTIPGIVFSFSQPIQCRIDELVAGTKAQLILKIFGDDIDMLVEKGEQIEKILSGIKGNKDLVVERITGQPYLNINIDRIKIARYGLNISDVQNVIEMAVAGKSASKLYEENKSFDIVVRLPEEKRNSLEAIGDILIPVNNNYRIPLNQLAYISFSEGPLQISRENGLRRLGIELNISGRDIGSFVAEAKKKISAKVKLPKGYFIEWGGQFENQERAMAKLLVVFPAVIVLILLLLFITFKSFRLAFLVLSNLPFALIGGVIALWLSGLYLSVPSSVGFIVLFGVAVLNGVVLVSQISNLRSEGIELNEAIIKGSLNRLRPVLMTASIAIFSLIPMIFATGTGSEIQKPLAVVVVGGLITSTFLTLLIIPSVYSWFEKKA